MAEPQHQGTGLRVTLDTWHPDCWTLIAIEEAEAGLLGHGVYTIDGMATGRFTVYGETVAAVGIDDLLEHLDDGLARELNVRVLGVGSDGAVELLEAPRIVGNQATTETSSKGTSTSSSPSRWFYPIASTRAPP